MKVFKIRDLTTKVVAAKSVGKTGSVGLLGPDQDPDDFTPITPWVMLGKHLAQVDYIDRLGDKIEKIDVETLDNVALNVGRAVVAGKFFPGTALCSIDMPTCARNERISPVASMVDTVTNLDLAVLREQLRVGIERIDRFEEELG